MTFKGIIQKALGSFSGSIDNKIYRAMLQYVGISSIIPITDNKESYIDNGYNKNILLYNIISYITAKACEIPLKHINKEDEEVIENSELIKLMNNPNSMQDYNEFIEQALGYLLLTGDCYIYKIAPKAGMNKGKPKELYILPSQYMRIVAGKNANRPIERYELIYNGNTANETYEPEQIIHVRLTNYNFQNGENLYGQSPLQAALQTLNKSNSNINAMTKQAQNSGALGILMHDAGANMVDSPNAVQLKTMANKVHKNIAGSDNKGKIHVTGDMFKWQQLGKSAADMQLLEDHKVSRNDLCATYKLSSMLFNDNSASTYNNMAEVRKAAYTDSILPYLNRIISEINRTITPYFDEQSCLKADTSHIEVLQKDIKEMISYLKDAYWIPTSKKQEMTGVEVDESMPQYLIPANLMPIGASMDDEIDESVKRYPDYQ